MTYLQPSKRKSFWRKIAVIGGIFFALEMGLVVYLYNRTVNLSAAIEQANTSTQQLGAQNAVMEHQTVVALDGSIRSQAPYNQLVEDTHPEYINTQLSRR